MRARVAPTGLPPPLPLLLALSLPLMLLLSLPAAAADDAEPDRGGARGPSPGEPLGPGPGSPDGHGEDGVWKTDTNGARFRVRFDPGERLIFATGAEALAGDVTGLATTTPGLALEIGLLLRGEPPGPGWGVHWKRNHEIVHLRLHPTAGARGAAVDGALYRGIFLRQSRDGTLTSPLTPQMALSLPFDIGVLAEVGHLHGPLWPEAGGPPVEAGLVHGEVLADFWRARQPGRWLTLGVGGRYEIGLERDLAGAWGRDHRVSPMTTMAVALHGERTDGLAAGGVRAEASHRWSSVRGWERAYRVDADAEWTPIAANDRPLALFALVTAETGSGGPPPRPELRVMAGIRLSQPLR
jgi:hypothetical protein